MKKYIYYRFLKKESGRNFHQIGPQAGGPPSERKPILWMNNDSYRQNSALHVSTFELFFLLIGVFKLWNWKKCDAFVHNIHPGPFGTLFEKDKEVSWWMLCLRRSQGQNPRGRRPQGFWLRGISWGRSPRETPRSSPVTPCAGFS